MKARYWLAGTALGITAVSGGARAAEPSAKPASVLATSFGTLKAVSAGEARQKLFDWLAAQPFADLPRAETLWADEGRPLGERFAAVVALARPDLAGLFADAERPDAPAPLEVPAALTDAGLDPFIRSNLQSAYGRALVGRRVYEEGLAAFAGVVPETLVDPAGYYFARAAAEHALMQREKAAQDLARLLDDVADVPDRYRVVATLLAADVQGWSKDAKDLGNITRLMDNSGRRLDLARAGSQTQAIQKKIVFRLDEKIKELEQKAQGKGKQQSPGKPGQPGGSQPGEGQCPAGGEGEGEGQGRAAGAPNQPQQDSFGGSNSGPGQVDEKKLRKFAEEWGKLPAAERARAVQEIAREVPPKFKPMIEEYFKSLNRLHGFPQ